MGKQANNACDKVFPQDRPNATTDKLKEFIVVSLPYSFVNRELSEDDWWLDATVVYDIYVADKKSANNPVQVDDKSMKRLRDALLKTFPLVNRNLGIKIVRPRIVIVSSSDGNGYHYSRVQARMTTMV
ncbi:MAG: hypothetical protein K6F47_00865 [Bacteroidaceae bacterium]|nr:hypothetical protein [Bacteroidaceae bacterium]